MPQPEMMILSHYTCSASSFALEIWDASNATGGFVPGDSVIIDPERSPVPGDMVLAVVEKQLLFRRYRKRGATIELLPLNPDWETVIFEPTKQNRLLGVMSEHARPARVTTAG
jgi:SOS-response transcriptional repressor LexA